MLALVSPAPSHCRAGAPARPSPQRWQLTRSRSRLAAALAREPSRQLQPLALASLASCHGRTGTPARPFPNLGSHG